MANWFISINGEQKGPYPTDQLRQLVADGFLSRDSYVWREGMPNWLPLSQVRITDDAPTASAAPQVRETPQSYQSQQDSGQFQTQGGVETTSSYVKPGYFSFYGRISRKTFWLMYVLLPMAILFLLSIPIGYYARGMNLGDEEHFNYTPLIGLGAAYGVVFLLLSVSGLSAQVKRLHDRGRSGWFVLLSLVPIANIWIFIEVAFLKGTTGPNEFGADPLG